MILCWVLVAALGVAGATPETAVPVEKDPMHRSVWEIQQYRVFDIVIPPYKSTLYHTHNNDMVGVTFAPPLPGGEHPAEKAFEIWFEPHATPYTHRITNPGDQPIHMMAFEFLRPLGVARPLLPLWPPVGTVEFENERIRVVRYSLAPGESVPVHVHQFPYLLVAVDPCQLKDACREDFYDQAADPGFLCIDTRGDHHFSNASDKSITVLELELRERP